MRGAAPPEPEPAPGAELGDARGKDGPAAVSVARLEEEAALGAEVGPEAGPSSPASAAPVWTVPGRLAARARA